MTSNFSKSFEVDLSDSLSATFLFRSEEFEPWEFDGMLGKKRTLLFVQKTLLGEVFRFKCHDIIVWKYLFPYHVEFVRKNWKGFANSFLTRFVFLHPTEKFSYTRKGLLWGLKGYLEVVVCPFPLKDDDTGKEVSDILPLLKIIT